MKVHTKKKAYRAALKQMAKNGMANRPDGIMVRRGQLKDDSMKRDYYPQEGKQ